MSHISVHDFKAGFFGKRHGYSLDIGCSLVKVVVLTPKSDDDENDSLIQATFARKDLDEALQFIKLKSTADAHETEEICTTGMGCHQFKQKIGDQLQVKLDNISEMDSFVKALHHMLKHQPLDKITFASSKVAEEYVAEQFKKLMESVMKMHTKYQSKQQFKFNKSTDPFPSYARSAGGPPPKPPTSYEYVKGGKPPCGGPTPIRPRTGTEQGSEKVHPGGNVIKGQPRSSMGGPPPGIGQSKVMAPPPWVAGGPKPSINDSPLFPCHIVIIGSGTTINMVNEDGSFKMIGGNTRGGRTFLSLASLLTGIQDYDELMSLAEKGTNMNVDIMGKHVKTDDDSDVYAVLPDDVVLIAYGQAMDKKPEDFKKEDLIRTLLTHICMDNAETAHMEAALRGVHHVFFCGSFSGQNQLIQDEISKVMLKRIQGHPQCPMKFHFLRNGSHLGAIGAMMKTFEKQGVDFSKMS